MRKTLHISGSDSDVADLRKNRRRSKIISQNSPNCKKRRVNFPLSGIDTVSYRNLIENSKQKENLDGAYAQDIFSDSVETQLIDHEGKIEFDSELWAKLQADVQGATLNLKKSGNFDPDINYASNDLEQRINAFATRRSAFEYDVREQRLSVEKVVTLRMLFHAISALPMWTEGRIKGGNVSTDNAGKFSKCLTGGKVRIFAPLTLSVGNTLDSGSLIHRIWFRSKSSSEVCPPTILDQRAVSRQGELALSECVRRGNYARKWLYSIGLWSVSGRPFRAIVARRLKQLFPERCWNIDTMFQVTENDKDEVLRLLQSKFSNPETVFQPDCSKNREEVSTGVIREDTSACDWINDVSTQPNHEIADKTAVDEKKRPELHNSNFCISQEESSNSIPKRISYGEDDMSHRLRKPVKSGRSNPFIDLHAEASDEESEGSDDDKSESDISELAAFIDDNRNNEMSELDTHLRLYAAQKELHNDRLVERLLNHKTTFQVTDLAHEYLTADVDSPRDTQLAHQESSLPIIESIFSPRDDLSDREESDGSVDDSYSSGSDDQKTSPLLAISGSFDSVNKDGSIIRRQRYKMRKASTQ